MQELLLLRVCSAAREQNQTTYHPGKEARR